MKYVVATYKNGKQHLGYSIAWIFSSKEAAQFWIDANKTNQFGFTFVIEEWPEYDLKTLKELALR